MSVLKIPPQSDGSVLLLWFEPAVRSSLLWRVTSSLCLCPGPKHMKREELEVSGEEATKYRKEPSPCPVCGKVRNVTHNWLAGLTSSRQVLGRFLPPYLQPCL